MAKPYKPQPDDRIPDDLTTPGIGAQIRASLMEKNRALGGQDPVVPSVGAAPVNASYIVLSADATLANERVLAVANDTNVTLTLSSTPTLATITAGWTGTLAIARGGTGQSTANAAFGALSPMTANGDLITRNGGIPDRVPLGFAGDVLQSNGTNVTWISGVLFDTSTPTIQTIWAWAIDNPAYIRFQGDYGSGDPIVIDLSDNNASQHIFLRGPGIGIAIADRTIRWPDANGTYVLVGDGADPPAAGFIGKVNRTGQVATVAATSLVDPAVTGGCFVVHYTLETTTGAVGAGTIQFQINYTDDIGATTQTSTALTLTVQGRTRGTLEVYATGGITYQTNLTGIFSTSQYALRVRCENLG